MKTIDIQTWKRKEHFEFFCGLDDPYWSITTELECTQTYTSSKAMGQSFFLSYLHKSLLAANQIEELKLRIVDKQVVSYEQVHASVTILRPDETFGCCFLEFSSDFSEFCNNASMQIEHTMASTGMCLEQDHLLNQIHYSSIPWCHFSALTYARSLKPQDSVPKITFGKKRKEGESLYFPIAIQVHHGLVDGLHVARFLDLFQSLLITK